jgi:hypothetical protein
MEPQIEIPPRLVRTVYRKASERNQSFEERDDWNNQARKWGVDPEDRHVVGLMGEMAFAIYADLEIDTDLFGWSDGGVDFKISIDGIERTVDIKTSQEEPYVLPVKEWRVESDYYVLGYLQETTVTFLGAATKKMVLDRERTKSKFGHYNYEVPISSLKSIPDRESIVSV